MSLVRFMNLHPNSDFVDVGTVERALLFYYWRFEQVWLHSQRPYCNTFELLNLPNFLRMLLSGVLAKLADLAQILSAQVRFLISDWINLPTSFH